MKNEHFLESQNLLYQAGGKDRNCEAQRLTLGSVAMRTECETRGNHGSPSEGQTFISVSGDLDFSPFLITEEKFLFCNGETYKDLLPIPYPQFSLPLLYILWSPKGP